MLFLKKAQSLQPWLSQVYRSLHKIPELGRELPKTKALVKRELDSMGIKYRECAGGILAELPAGKGKPIVALRADMDALPVTEKTGLPHSSIHPGKMHACGHDAHMTCALGALKLLSGEDERSATLRIMFQPAEETTGGADLMIKDGALDGVSRAICLHIASYILAGQIGVITGPTRGSSDDFYITIHGRGSHGGYPHLGIDVITGAAQIVSTLQTLISRETNPFDSAVITIGKLDAGTAPNVIPDTAHLAGTIRALRQPTREYICHRMREVVTQVASAMRMSAEIAFDPSYPALFNDAGESERVRKVGVELLGAENVITPEFPQLGVDDFAYVTQKVPGCYVDLGCGRVNETPEPLHSPKLFPDESCLAVGAALIAAYTLD